MAKDGLDVASQADGKDEDATPGKTGEKALPRRRDLPPRWLYIALPLLCLAICLLWAANLPVYRTPDEYMRLYIPYYFLRHHALPLGSDLEVVHFSYGTSYAFFPYGTSLLSMLFASIGTVFTSSVDVLTFLMRIPSALFISGAVAICELTGKRLFSSPWSPLVFAALVGFLPQALYLGSYLNQDSMEIFATALVLYAWVRGVQDGWTPPACAILGISLGVCALSYYFCYAFILLSLPVYFVSAARAVRRNELSRRSLWLGALLVAVLAILVGGWFFIRNLYLYHDLFGRNASQATAERYAEEGMRPSQRLSPRDEGSSPVDVFFTIAGSGMPWWETTLKSFIACFGAMDVFVSDKIYTVYILTWILGLVCAPVWCVRGRHFDSRGLVLLCLLGAGLFSAVLTLYYSWTSDFQPQGRYAMGALVGLSCFVCGGYDVLSGATRHGREPEGRHARTSPDKARNTRPGALARIRAILPGLVLAGLVALAVYTLVFYAIPNCTGPIDTLGNNPEPLGIDAEQTSYTDLSNASTAIGINS